MKLSEETLFILLSGLLKTVHTICPNECICISDKQRMVRCDSVPMGEIPALLDPRIKSLSMSNCSLKSLDRDVLELYPGLLIFFFAKI